MPTLLKKLIIAFLAGWVILISGFGLAGESVFKSNSEDVLVQETLDKAGTSSISRVHTVQGEKRLSERHIFFNRTMASHRYIRQDAPLKAQPALAGDYLYAWSRGPPVRLG